MALKSFNFSNVISMKIVPPMIFNLREVLSNNFLIEKFTSLRKRFFAMFTKQLCHKQK